MLNISRVTAMPSTPEANTIYMVADGASGLQVVITGSTAQVIKSTYSNQAIQSMIDSTVGATAIQIANDYHDDDVVLQGNIEAEAVLRSDGDAATLAAAKAYSDAQDALQTSALQAEIASAVSGASGTSDAALASAVSSLTTLIDNETTARAAADSALQATDASQAAAITSLQSGATAEEAARIAGDSATLASAKTYTDTTAAAAQTAAQTFASAADTALRSDLEGQIGTVADDAAADLSNAVVSMTDYTDTRATAAQAAAIAHADALVAGLDMSNSAIYAADIDARNALIENMSKNSFVMVADASADPTVDTGSALYFRNVDTNTWTKVAEYESMDIIIPNLDILADLGDDGGLLTYKGTLVATVQHTGSEW